MLNKNSLLTQQFGVLVNGCLVCC